MKTKRDELEWKLKEQLYMAHIDVDTINVVIILLMSAIDAYVAEVIDEEGKIDDTIDVVNENDVIEAFNKFIKKWCGGWYPHLIDSDGNDGQAMREKLVDLLEGQRAGLERREE